MVLKRQDDGEGRGLEGALCYSLDHLLKTHTHKKNNSIYEVVNSVEYTHPGKNVIII